MDKLNTVNASCRRQAPPAVLDIPRCVGMCNHRRCIRYSVTARVFYFFWPRFLWESIFLSSCTLTRVSRAQSHHKHFMYILSSQDVLQSSPYGQLPTGQVNDSRRRRTRRETEGCDNHDMGGYNLISLTRMSCQSRGRALACADQHHHASGEHALDRQKKSPHPQKWNFSFFAACLTIYCVRMRS